MLAFVTAFATAYQLENFQPLPKGGAPAYARWLEGVLQAGATALAAIVVVGYGLPAVGAEIETFADVLDYIGNHPTRIAGVASITAAIGLYIGAMVPTWYRTRPGDEEHSEVVGPEIPLYVRH